MVELATTNGSFGTPAGRIRPRNRLHNQITEIDEGTEAEDIALETAHMYHRMHQAGTVKWARAQLQKLFKENRWFRWAQVGHRAPECKNSPVDPNSHQYNNMVSHDIEVLENIMKLLHALYELHEAHVHPHGGASQ
jgi:hypothetical protein